MGRESSGWDAFEKDQLEQAEQRERETLVSCKKFLMVSGWDIFDIRLGDQPGATYCQFSGSLRGGPRQKKLAIRLDAANSWAVLEREES